MHNLFIICIQPILMGFNDQGNLPLKINSFYVSFASHSKMIYHCGEMVN